jgi:polar amino acid transport system substrate-binding protein
MTNTPPAACTAEAALSLAPRGRLRAAINLGNAVLAQKDPATGALDGVSVALARELGRRLKIPVEFAPYDTAGKVVDALAQDGWDVAFLAVDPGRAATVRFTAPYVYIDGTYLVRADSPWRRVEDLDRAGVRIAVERNAAYDLYLSRSLKHAEIVRDPTSQGSFDLFLQGGADAAAGVRQALAGAAKGRPDLRVLDSSFQRIEQAMGAPRGRREAGAACLEAFLDEMKSSGFIRAALDHSGQADTVMAPPRGR